MLTKKKNLVITALITLSLLMSVFSLTSCSSTSNLIKTSDKVIKSTDGKLQISVPENWKIEKSLNEQAVIQVANKGQEKYLIVICENKSDFSADIKLDDYLKAVNQNFSESVTNAQISEAKDITINGYPAKQYEVKGEVDKIKAAYLVTLVQTPNGLNQVMAWTLQSKFSDYKQEFTQVTSSFKEVK